MWHERLKAPIMHIIHANFQTMAKQNILVKPQPRCGYANTTSPLPSTVTNTLIMAVPWKPRGQLQLPPQQVAKTLVMEDENAKPFIIIMHGDRDVSTKNLARQIGVKKISPCKPEVAQRHTAYQVGGTSPFGTRKPLSVYIEADLLELDIIYINGGRRGYLLGIEPTLVASALNAVTVNVAIPH